MNKMNFREILYKWIIIKNVEKDEWLKKNMNQNDTDLLAFIYSDHQCGLSAKIEYSCVLNEVNDLKEELLHKLDPEVFYIFRYSVWSKLICKPLGKEIVEKLGLPLIPDWVKYYRREELHKLQGIKELDSFRADGFPDDVRVILPAIDGNKSEGVWVKLDKYDENEKVFKGTLLNQPYQDFKIKMFDPVDVVLISSEKEQRLFCKTVLDKFNKKRLE